MKPNFIRKTARLMALLLPLYLAVPELPAAHAAPAKITPISVTGKSTSGYPAANAIDGNVATYWTSPASNTMQDHNRNIDIQLDGLYDLSSIVIKNPTTPAGVYYHYQVYASENGENFTKIAYKSDSTAAVSGGKTFDLTGTAGAKGVSIVRINLSYASDTFAGRISEVELYGEKKSSTIPAKPAVSVTDFEDTEWAAEYTRFATDTNYARTKTIDEMSSLVGRVLGSSWINSFVFEIEDISSNGQDAFEIEGASGIITIRGRNGISMASGFNYYLKNYANVNYNPLFVSNLDMPDTLPMPAGTIVRETDYDERYALNFCTLSYTMAFWGWDEYEAYLDWAAMNGINLILDIAGQEEVLRRVLLQYGYSETEIRDYISGPAYFAWFYMQNMTGFGGPLPDNWFSQRVELGRQMHDRMQTYGIRPVLQGYSGMVPTDFAAKNAGAQVISQGSWCGFTRPSMLRTLVTSGRDYFSEVADAFYEAQNDLFGDVTDYYAVDPFHEGGNMGGMNATSVYARIQQKMMSSDPDAVWVVQQWLNNITTAKLNGLNKDHVIVLDLFSEMRPQHTAMESTGVDWIWNMLHSFGGRMGLFGDLPIVTQGPPTDFDRNNYMVGIGVTAEAYSNSGIMYDLMGDMTWISAPISYQDYLESYVKSRYGELNQNALDGWNILAETAYASKTAVVQGPPESVINARPGMSFTTASTWGNGTYMYDKEELEAALPYFIAAYDELSGNPAFVYDFVEVTAQVLSTATLEYYRSMIAAYGSNDETAFMLYSEKFLNGIRLMEEVLAVSPEFGVGQWIEGSRTMMDDMDDWTKDLFEFNARALITTWGGQKNVSGGLGDYSNRQWSGLTEGLYLKRWERFVNALRNGTAVPSSNAYFQMEWEWANQKSDEGHGYSTVGSGGNLKALASSVYASYTLTNMDASLAEERANIALSKTVTASPAGGTTANLTNGDTGGSPWSAASADVGSVTLTLDLGGTKDVDGVAFVMEQAAGGYLITYQVEALLGDEATLIAEKNDATPVSGTIELDYTGQADKIRYTFAKHSNAPSEYILTLTQLMVYGGESTEPAALNVAAGKTASYAAGSNINITNDDSLKTSLKTVSFSGTNGNLTNGDLNGTAWGPQSNYPVAFKIDLGQEYFIDDIRTAFERLETGNTNPNITNPDPQNNPLKSYKFKILTEDAAGNMTVVLDKTNHTGNLDSRFYTAEVQDSVKVIYAVILSCNTPNNEIGAGNGWPAFTQIQAFEGTEQPEQPEPPEENVSAGKSASVAGSGLDITDDNTLKASLKTASFSGSNMNLTNGDLNGTAWGPQSNYPVAFKIDLGKEYRISEIKTAFERLETGNTNPSITNPDPDNLPLKSYKFKIITEDAAGNMTVVLDKTNHTGNLDSRFYTAQIDHDVKVIYAVILGHNGQTNDIGAGNGWPAFTQIQAFGFED